MKPESQSNSRQLLIVSRRFWPHAGLTEIGLADLACNLRDAGHQVTVATIRESKDWCDEFDFNGIRVVRFARPVSGPWSSYRYARSIAKLLGSIHYDGVIVSGLGDEAAAVSKAIDDFTPVVLYVDEGFEGVETSIHRRHVETCLAADAVIANSHAVGRHLNSIVEMPPVAVIETELKRQDSFLPNQSLAIRSTLTKTHPVLRLEPDQPLAVAFSRMHHDCGVEKLVQAWPNVLKRYPGAKLWLLGDGPQTSTIWNQIVRLDLCYSVQLPGFFDNLDDIFMAADLYLHADGPTQTGDGMARAITCGLPVLCSRTEATIELAAKLNMQHSSISFVANEQDWASQLPSKLTDLRGKHTIGQAATQPATLALNSQAVQFAKLFESLSAQILEPAK